jgi:DNA-directed RNA polymerase subunit M/transcription elongation factor TFIIS
MFPATAVITNQEEDGSVHETKLELCPSCDRMMSTISYRMEQIRKHDDPV